MLGIWIKDAAQTQQPSPVAVSDVQLCLGVVGSDRGKKSASGYEVKVPEVPTQVDRFEIDITDTTLRRGTGSRLCRSHELIRGSRTAEGEDWFKSCSTARVNNRKRDIN